MSAPSDFLALLKNHIDLVSVPFSDRGSRILLFRTAHKASLHVKLAERLTFLDGDIEAYLRRPPFIRDLCLLDEAGSPLDFTITTYPHQLILSTAIGDFGVAFQDEHTLAIGLPAGRQAGIGFIVDKGKGETLLNGGRVSSYRTLDYHCNTALLIHAQSAEQGDWKVELRADSTQNGAIALRMREDEKDGTTSELPAFSPAVARAARRWEEWFAKAPPVDERYQKTYYLAWWVMANNLLSPRGCLAYEGMVPSKTKYVGLWLWDSALHALAFRHIDSTLAQNQLRAMLAYQLPDGMLPDAIYDEGVVSEIGHPIRARVTKPPILAWAAMKLYEHNKDAGFIREIYPRLCRWNAWWFQHNCDEHTGLAQYSHPYSSGLDDNPLWDEGMPVVSPDLNTYLVLQMQTLSRMAAVLGLEGEAESWQTKATVHVGKMITALYDEQEGYFNALHNGQPVPVLTPFNLYPLWTARMPAEIQARLLGHLTNPKEFWGKYALPTVARNDGNYDPATMWRGPVWANINYFFIEVLNNIGEVELAGALREKTLEMIMAQAGIFEYYNAASGKPGNHAAPIFGWTAAVFIDLAIQASTH
jgi:putative isomerase